MAKSKKCSVCGELLVGPRENCPRCLFRMAAGLAPGQTKGGPELEEESPDTVIGHYRLVRKIGEGGFGVVYLAEQEEPVRRQVAFKILKPGMDTRQVVARFEAERQALALMEHPNIAKVLDGGTTPPAQGSRPFFVMELADGVPITDYCDQLKLATEERLELFMAVCQAIQHAHQKGVIHRDIKPSNVLVVEVDGKPVPKIIDFGIAKATQEPLTEKTLFTRQGQFIGTPVYMSPEQAGPEDVDTRTDIYSLGVLLYELLTGRTPFDRLELLKAGYDEICRKIREEEPLKPSTRISTLGEKEAKEVARCRNSEPERLCRRLHGDLDWIVMKTLEKDRNRRFDTANGLAMDLRRYLKNEPVEAAAPSVGYRFRKFARRNKFVLAMTGAIGCALLIGVAVSLWQAHRAAEEAEANRRNSYAADMLLAQRELEMNNVRAALSLLDQHIPQPGQEDLRNWEWRYLRQLCWSDDSGKIETGPNRINGMCYLEGGSYLAVGLVTGQVEIWDVQKRERVTSLDCYGSVLALRASPKGHLLAAGTANTFLHVWDTKSFVKLKDLEGATIDVIDMAFSSDGGLLALAGGPCKIWNTKTFAEEATISGVTTTMDWSPDGKYFVQGIYGGQIHVWSWPELTKVMSVSRETTDWFAQKVRFSADGKLIAAVGGFANGWSDSTIELWNVPNGTKVGTLTGHTGLIRALEFLPDGKTLVSASFDETIRLWDLESLQETAKLKGHQDTLWSLAAHPKGTSLASGDDQGNVLFWMVGEQANAWHREILPVEVTDFAFLPDGETLVAVSEGKVSLWDLNRLQLKAMLDRLGEDNQAVLVSPIGRLIIVGGKGGQIQIWDQTDQRLIRKTQQHRGKTFPLAFFDDSRRMVSIDETDQVIVWDVESWTALLTFEALGSTELPAVSTEQEWLAASSNTKEVKIWDLRVGEELFSFPGNWNAPAAFSADDRWMAIGGDALRLRSGPTFEEVQVIEAHRYGTLGLGFSPDSLRLSTICADADCMKLWDMTSRREVLRLPGRGRFSEVSFSLDGNIIGAKVSSGRLGDKPLLLWRAPSLEQIEVVEREAALDLVEKVPPMTTRSRIERVAEGGNVTLRIEASEGESRSCQWFYNGTDVLIGETNTTLLLTNVQLSQAGTYLGVVSNRNGAVNSINTTLKVLKPWPAVIRGDPKDVAIVGHLAYVAAEDGGLFIVDVSDATQPLLVGTLNLPWSAEAVDVAGQYAYVANDRAGLQVIDISDAGHPIRVGGCETGGRAQDVKLQGQYAYLADSGAGLQVIDVSDPSMPRRVNGFDTGGDANAVFAAGNYVYIADRKSGLLIIDASNPTRPVFVGRYNTGGSPNDVVVDGQFAYVADGDQGLLIIDVSDPTNPKLVGDFEIDVPVNGVQIRDKHVYLAAAWFGLQIIDVSDPAHPVRIGRKTFGGLARQIAVSAQYVYAADSEEGLIVVNVNKLSKPLPAGRYAAIGSSRGIRVVGQYAYVADYTGGLHVLDINDPLRPIRLGGLKTPGWAEELDVTNGYAYVADQYNGLLVIDIRDPFHPVQVGHYDTKKYASGIQVVGNYAYVADGPGGLVVIDVSEPTNPTLKGSQDTIGAAQNVSVLGSYAYLACRWAGVQVIDVSDPSSPVLMGSYNTGGSGRDVAVWGTHAYLADGINGLVVIDISDPANLVRVGGYKTGIYAEGVHVTGNHLYVVDRHSGLFILDVSDPTNPSLISHHDTKGTAYDVQAVAEHVYVADGEWGVSIFKVDQQSGVQR